MPDTNDTDETLLTLDRRKHDSDELGDQLRIRVREFKGTKFVDIRLFWRTDDGELRPGKKGISLRRNELEEAASALQRAANALAGACRRQPSQPAQEAGGEIPFG